GSITLWFVLPIIDHYIFTSSYIATERNCFGFNGFNLQSPAALPPSKSVSLSFAALNPGIVFSSFEMYVLSGIFFQNNPVSSTLKICCAV
uniref:Uncharacterized protein n=1 Tax=Gopherus agassizii TaxID=38772 RepID=A0A452GZY8_9SAUR